MRFRQLLIIVLLPFCLVRCGFKPQASGLTYPFTVLAVTSEDPSWQYQVSQQLRLSDVTTKPNARYTLHLTRPSFSHSNMVLNTTQTAQTIVYSLTTTASFSIKQKPLLTKTFTTSLPQYSQSSQLFTPIPGYSFKQQLYNNLLSQVAYWLASIDVKQALRGPHAN